MAKRGRRLAAPSVKRPHKLTVLLSDGERAALQAVMTAEGRTAAALVRGWIDEYEERETTE